MQHGLVKLLGSEAPWLMGVLNVTPDSFTDGGQFLEPEAAIEQARRLQADGADIIDIGGESTAPGNRPITSEEELRRIEPVVRALAAQAVVSVLIPKDHVREAVKSEIRAATGLDPLLRGDVSVSLFPYGQVTLTDVALGEGTGESPLQAAQLVARLSFLPLLMEHYDLVVPHARRDRAPVRRLIDLLRSDAGRDILRRLGFDPATSPPEASV